MTKPEKGNQKEKSKSPNNAQGTKLKRMVDKNKKEEDWWSMGAASETEHSDGQWEKQDRSRDDKRQERKITFRELLARLYEVFFIRKMNFQEKIGQVIKLCVEWVVLVVVDNVSEWPLLKAIIDFMYG
ncbi:hypothetical protein O0L34_g19297 [Tuta absoluta]|nr:hypothetical protein O0L34_g19297 [Tuta absoluta]